MQWKPKLLLLVFFGLLAACGNNQGEQIYKSWEKAAETEKNVSSFQNPRGVKENMEFDLFKIMSSKKTIEEISPLSEKAIASAEERRDLLEQERSIRFEAYGQFQEALPEKNNLNESIKAPAEEAVELMEKRYYTYEELIDIYNRSIDKDIDLYRLLSQESLSAAELEDHQNAVNDFYNEIEELNETFNRQTEKFNDAKLEFYSAAGIELHH